MSKLTSVDTLQRGHYPMSMFNVRSSTPTLTSKWNCCPRRAIVKGENGGINHIPSFGPEVSIGELISDENNKHMY